MVVSSISAFDSDALTVKDDEFTAKYASIEETSKDTIALLNGRGIARGGFDDAAEAKLLEEWAAR